MQQATRRLLASKGKTLEELELAWTLVIAAAAILGVHGAYYGALADACLKVGTGLVDTGEGGTGVQDAITPPASTNARMINWLATLLLAGVSWYDLGATGVAVFIAIRFVATLISGAVLKADPPKKHFCGKVYSSMANREANYAKAGDTVRAEAMKELRIRFEHSRFASQLTQ